jgi:hypothetical protein
MANWKEIQGRIRRAKKSADPAAPLTALYEKTRDAMVAFELARHLEQAGDTAGAGRWYSTAAAGFRRPQWKAKAEEAMTRLGVAAEPVVVAPIPVEERIAETSFAPETTEGIEAGEEKQPEFGQAAPGQMAGAAAAALAGRRRRRGRRGGRKHRRKGRASEAAAAPQGGVEELGTEETRAAAAAAAQVPGPVIHEEPSGVRWRAAEPATPAEEAERAALPGLRERGRAGDPGLSSRMALLESQLRRMLAATPVGVDEADRAPAGPGVFLLSDTDLQTHYYVEACQTLRIGIRNLTRAGRQAAGRGATGSALKARLAEHLGISETKAAKYLSDHCAVRWLQLDDAANLLAHFAIAVLRPVLNE